jgi:glycosyltransferase involved in cell wall biosynthesis
MEKVQISVVIITKNEENNIEACLQSVCGWADEIIVVDDNSSDRTVSLAQPYATKIFYRSMDNEGTHRNWAYAQAQNDWVLSLDADERVTPELRDEIRQTLTAPQAHCYTIPRRNYIGDYWVKHGGQYPAAQLRLFLKDRFRYEEVEVHPRVFFEGETGHLQKDIIHKSYRDFSHFLAKLNAQTTLEAKKWVQTGRKMPLRKALWRTVDRFFRAYLGKKGYKDGMIGFMFAVFASFYQIMSYAKYWEMKRAPQISQREPNH